FPYDTAGIREAFVAMSQALLNAINCPQSRQQHDLRLFYKARDDFKRLLVPDDYKYFAFQCWQEGVARYTELRVAELASKHCTPGREFLNLSDYKQFDAVADSIRSDILGGLRHPALATSKRVAFYAFGAGEAMLLDKLGADWKREYLQKKFQPDALFPQ
ncbi:MAG TPA: hypothetical protein VI758_03005, partial [Bacteroidota bacterium]